MRPLVLPLFTLVSMLPCLGAAAEPPRRPMPGLDLVPFEYLDGEVGSWVRYRVVNDDRPDASYLTLALVGRDETGRLWLEMKVSHSPAPGSSGFGARVLLDRAEDGGLEPIRTIVSFNGSAPVELDPAGDSSVEDEDASADVAGVPDESVPPPSKVCMASNEPECLQAGLRYLKKPRLTVMTGLGTLSVLPVEVRSKSGSVYTFYISEAVPLTRLAGYDAPLAGSRMEIDAAGDDAKQTIGPPVRRATTKELAGALVNGTPQLRPLSRLGIPVNADERKAEGEGRNESSQEERDATSP